MTAPRTRFAPSPTGYFHVGGARTALYNWLFARQQGGELVLRIEDTDAERNRPEWVEGILEAMRWLGITWDGDPVFQSGSTGRHLEVARKLHESGAAYWCDCTRDDVDARNVAAGRPKEHGYDRFCRDRGLEAGEGRALRFRVPPGATTFDDVIRGEVTVEHDRLEDFVLVRGNGAPIFVLANTVDDLDLGITHVIRGEEHLPNVPKAILVLQALGVADLPTFAHVPVLVNEKRQKLSKRRDKVDVTQYRQEGYVAEALVNHLALLGWAPGDDRELLTREELLEAFRLEDVGNSPAFFDEVKLAHINQLWLKDVYDLDRFLAEARPFLEAGPWPEGRFDAAALGPLLPELPSRVKVLSEVPRLVDFLFLDEPPLEPADWRKEVLGREWALPVLEGVTATLGTLPEWHAEGIKAAVTSVGEQHELSLGKAQAPVRIATTGRRVGPPLFEALEALGQPRTLERLRTAVHRARERWEPEAAPSAPAAGG